MARRSSADKAETHERIVEHAAQAFREHGSGVGIGEVMKDLGLTHGGFYRHFESKDDLARRGDLAGASGGGRPTRPDRCKGRTLRAARGDHHERI